MVEKGNALFRGYYCFPVSYLHPSPSCLLFAQQCIITRPCVLTALLAYVVIRRFVILEAQAWIQDVESGRV